MPFTIRKCAVRKCPLKVEEPRIFCPAHWEEIPPELQREIFESLADKSKLCVLTLRAQARIGNKARCRGCGKPLDPANYRLADGCPCNSRRGVNHGSVPRETCTCPECDPEQTGSVR